MSLFLSVLLLSPSLQLHLARRGARAAIQQHRADQRGQHHTAGVDGAEHCGTGVQTPGSFPQAVLHVRQQPRAGADGIAGTSLCTLQVQLAVPTCRLSFHLGHG